MSHTRDIALIAIAHGLPPASRIGVDIEREDRTLNADGLARKFLTERERRCSRRWTPTRGDADFFVCGPARKR